MNDNILVTVKRAISIAEEDASFDGELLLYINATLGILSQIGLSEASVLPIIDEQTDWDELLGDRTDLEMVKTYLGLKVKSVFDPPTSSALADALNRTIGELEWRIQNIYIINKEVTT